VVLVRHEFAFLSMIHDIGIIVARYDPYKIDCVFGNLRDNKKKGYFSDLALAKKDQYCYN
jgi:hypothetical protein